MLSGRKRPKQVLAGTRYLYDPGRVRTAYTKATKYPFIRLARLMGPMQTSPEGEIAPGSVVTALTSSKKPILGLRVGGAMAGVIEIQDDAGHRMRVDPAWLYIIYD